MLNNAFVSYQVTLAYSVWFYQFCFYFILGKIFWFHFWFLFLWNTCLFLCQSRYCLRYYVTNESRQIVYWKQKNKRFSSVTFSIIFEPREVLSEKSLLICTSSSMQNGTQIYSSIKQPSYVTLIHFIYFVELNHEPDD